MTVKSKSARLAVSMAAIDPYIETHIVSPAEREMKGKALMSWGDRNLYPEYLLSLYREVPTLRSIIDGNRDYVTGDRVTAEPLHGELGPGTLNRRGDTPRELVRDLAQDYEMYGGFAIQVIRDYTGAVAELYYIDIRFLRANKDCNVFYYCEDWRYRRNVIMYPAFLPGLDWTALSEEDRERNASSILYVKTTHTQTYPAPLYAAAVKACEIERLASDFHINSLNNQFVTSAIVNFNGGIPTDEVKEEIEREFNEKFCGAGNAGRVMLSWNRDKDSATDVVEFKVEDFGERYKALAEHSREQIFTAFRAIPLLFGLTAGTNTGFSTNEFEQSFRLYNRTQIMPVQRMIADAFARIYGREGVLSIEPFTLDGPEKTIN